MKNKQTTLALGASVAASASLLAATSSERYVYDASGNIVEKQIGEQVSQFDYSGNLLKGSLLDATQKQYQYDNAGRLVGELREAQVVRKLSYQFADRVTRVVNGDKCTELFYNAEGQLVGTNSEGNLEAFAWDGLSMISRGEKAFANEEHMVGGVPALVGGEVVVSDMLGSTLSLGGESLDSSAFGEGLKNGFLTGKPFVQELGGFFFKHRSYSAEDARWTTADPSGFPDGSNCYSFVTGDPINGFDRLGLSTSTSWTVESTPEPSDDIGGNPPTPGTDWWWDGTETTNDLEWRHTSWKEVGNAKAGNCGKKHSGTFEWSLNTSSSVTVSGKVLEYNATVSAGSSGSTNYEIGPTPNVAYRARPVVERGKVYRIKQDWRMTGGVWLKDGSEYEAISLSVKNYTTYGVKYWCKEC